MSGFFMACGGVRSAKAPRPVQNGLVFWLDALNNTGSGLSTSATTWVDLIGGNNVPIDLSRAAWQNNMCYLLTGALGNLYSTAKTADPAFTGSGAFTAEAVVLFSSSLAYGWACCIKAYGVNNYWQVYKLSGTKKMAYRINSSEAANNEFSTFAAVATLTVDASGAAVFYANGVANKTQSFSE